MQMVVSVRRNADHSHVLTSGIRPKPVFVVSLNPCDALRAQQFLGRTVAGIFLVGLIAEIRKLFAWPFLLLLSI